MTSPHIPAPEDELLAAELAFGLLDDSEDARAQGPAGQ